MRVRDDSPPPRRRFGQNFLVDRGAVRRIVDAVSVGPSDAVVEIGPGRGALTAELLDRCGRVAAVEVDRDLAARLRDRFDPGRLVLIEADILRVDWSDLTRALDLPPGGRLVVVGNLPYNVSKPLAMVLVDRRRRLDRAVLTFQREVVERLAAPCGTRDYGALTVLVGLAYHVEPLFDLAPGCFRPRPRVHSTVTRWIPRDPGLADELVAPLRACLTASFARRRQTLRNNLRAALGGDDAADRVLDAAALDGGARPEAVPPEGFVRLARRWPRSR